jgi:hypothetical protein
MAEVHVDVSPTQKTGSLPTRSVRWFERAVVRGTRHAEDEREEALDRKVAPD